VGTKPDQNKRQHSDTKWCVRNTNMELPSFCRCGVCHQKEYSHPHQYNCTCLGCYTKVYYADTLEDEDPYTEGCCRECKDDCLERAEKVEERCDDVRYTDFADGLVLESKWLTLSAKLHGF
jgi:hypothetical protein